MNNIKNYHPQVTISQEEVDAAGGYCFDVLRRDYHDCETCGMSIHNNDTTSTCDPKLVRQHNAWKRANAQKAAIRKRMEEREAKFREAQARDEMTIYKIDHKRRGY
jgi:adenine-specific DNA methylase